MESALESPVFEAFPKIYRWSREIIITEKIDGTNGVIDIATDDVVRAGSRSRWITPEDDNFGFARWVHAHEADLRTELGHGRHFGEWWGASIQRRYGLKEKRFSLFNVSRWSDPTPPPAVCHVVPVLYRGLLSDSAVHDVLAGLRTNGSYAAPGFMQPEGIVIFHVPSRALFKKTLDKDEEPAGKHVI